MRLQSVKLSHISIIVITFVFVAQSLRFAYGSISLLLLIAVGIAGFIKNRQKFETYYLWPLLLFGFMLFSVAWTADISLTLKGLIRLSPLLLIPLAINLGYDLSKKDYHNIFNGFSLVYAFLALAFIAIAFVKYLNTKDMQYLFYHKLVEPAKLNAIYASSFAYVAYMWILLKKHNKIVYQISALILFAFIVLLSSKILIALTVLSSLFLLIYVLKSKHKLIVGLVLVGLAVVFVLKPKNFITERFLVENTTNTKEILESPKFTKVYPWTGFGLRLFQMRVGVEIIKDNPSILIMGVGFNSSQPFIEDKHTIYNLYPGYYEYNFHNQYVQTLVELGLIGLLLLFMCLFNIFQVYFRKGDLFSLFIFVLFLALFITESYLMRQRGIIFFALLYAILPKLNDYNLKSTHEKHYE
jgi:O-antigen ligase